MGIGVSVVLGLTPLSPDKSQVGVQRLMAKMSLEALFSRPRTSNMAPARVYVYLLNDEELTHVDEN
jgi:hypothetical protein